MSRKFLYLLVVLIVILLSISLVIQSDKRLENQMDFKKEFIADSFIYPVGKPDGKGYYNAQKFGVNNHLGDDWNGKGGGNTDFGDSIFSIGNGLVVSVKNHEGGWGKVIRIKHKFKSKFYESLYAHCSKITVKKGDWIRKGQFIGKIGDCNGKYKAHLHFEVRDSIEMPLGPGYSANNQGYINPTEFIVTNNFVH